MMQTRLKLDLARLALDAAARQIISAAKAEAVIVAGPLALRQPEAPGQLLILSSWDRAHGKPLQDVLERLFFLPGARWPERAEGHITGRSGGVAQRP